MMKYDDIMIEMIRDLLANNFHMVRDVNGDYESPRQSISREQLEAIAGVLYESITVIEIMKMEVDDGKRNKS